MPDDVTPWWYSGPVDDGAGGAGERSVGPQGSPTDNSSGSKGESPGSDDEPLGSIDWMGMIAGASRMVDWARGAVLDPHGGHDVPADHPDCLICRTLTVVGEQSGMFAGSSSEAGDDPSAFRGESTPVPAIEWIEIRDSSD